MWKKWIFFFFSGSICSLHNVGWLQELRFFFLARCYRWVTDFLMHIWNLFTWGYSVLKLSKCWELLLLHRIAKYWTNSWANKNDAQENCIAFVEFSMCKLHVYCVPIYAQYQRRKAKQSSSLHEREKNLMHILYHAPFALNSFNIYFFFVEFVCLLSAFFFFFFSLSALYLLQFSLFIYRRCWILNTELHILCSSALLPVSIFA